MLTALATTGAARAEERDLVGWFKTLCVDTAPSFRDVEARVTAVGGKAEGWPEFRLTSAAMIEVKAHRGWIIDAPMRNAGLRILRSEGTVGEFPARSCYLSLKFPLGSSEKQNELLPLANAAVVETRLRSELSLGAPMSTGPHVFYGRYTRWHLPIGTTLAFVDMQEPAQWPPETQFAALVLIVMDQTKLGRARLEEEHSYTYHVDMKNITLSIEEDVLREARKIAAERGTTVNAIVRASLAELVRQKKRTRDALKRMRELAEEGGMELGKKSWSRDDLHER